MTRMKEYRNSAGLFTALVLPCHSLLGYIITLNLNAYLKPWAKNSFSFYVLHDFFLFSVGILMFQVLSYVGVNHQLQVPSVLI